MCFLYFSIEYHQIKHTAYVREQTKKMAARRTLWMLNEFKCLLIDTIKEKMVEIKNKSFDLVAKSFAFNLCKDYYYYWRSSLIVASTRSLSEIACSLQCVWKLVSFNNHCERFAHGTCASILHPRCKHVTTAPYCSQILHLCREQLQTAASKPTIRAPTMYTPSDQTTQSSCTQAS